MNTDNYLFGERDGVSERLELVNKIYDPYSHTFIRNALSSHRGKALEIACARGTMSCWLSSQPEVDSVLGIDISEESIKRAEELGQTLNLTNTHFKVHSVYDLSLLEEEFDIIYLRFVLIHLTSPIAALRSVYNKLKPGGIMICETAIHGHCFSSPPNTCYDQFIKFVSILLSSQGKDPDLGKRIFAICTDLKFSIEALNFVQPMLRQEHEKKAMFLGLQHAKRLFARENLASIEELDALEEQMARDYRNTDSLWAAPVFCQLLASKPA